MTGKIVIENFMSFLSFCQDLDLSHATFLHFFMFFHQLHSLNDIEKVKFGSKERNLIHLLALNGNLCLLRYLFEKL